MKKVPGYGPPSPIFFCGEAPGFHEEKAGRPFVERAPAGSIFTAECNRIGIDRDKVYITNLRKTRLPARKTTTWEMMLEDEEDLRVELDRIKPRFVIAMGAWATRYFLGEVLLEAVHGIPHLASYPHNGRECIVLPTFHPASAIHQPETGVYVSYDFDQLKALIAGKLPSRPPQDQYPSPIYTEDDLKKPWSVPWPLLALDTEGGKKNPWGLSFTDQAGCGYIIRCAGDPCGIEAFGEKVWSDNPLVILHGSLHDLGILARMGIHLSYFTDTMLMAFLVGAEPQGLKPLAYRHAGMEMKSYPEVTRAAGHRIAMEYLSRLLEISWPAPAPQVRIEKGGKIKLYCPQTMEKRATRLLKDLAQNHETDPRARWGKITEDLPDVAEQVENSIGPLPEVTLDDVGPREAVSYSGRDADATFRVYPFLKARVEALGLERTLQMDLDVIPMISRMMEVGMAVDRDYLTPLGNDLGSEMSRLEEEVHQLTGHRVNLASGDQVTDLLFSKLRLPAHRLTRGKTRFAVDDKVLGGLRGEHPVVGLILSHRECHKLRNTYATRLPLWIGADDRIHPQLRITRVPTGRLSASDPNLLAIPVRTELGRKIRRAFIAPPGSLLGSWDLDQIEMRVMAHESEDSNLMAVLSDPQRHIHKETCAHIYGMKVDEVDKDSSEYKLAKNISFGVMYGLTASGLQDQMHKRGRLDMSQSDCQHYIDEWFALYPAVYPYMESKKAEARRYGYVRDMWGRLRWIGGIHSPIPAIREEAARQAANHAIQAGSQGIIKVAMAVIWKEILPLVRAEGYPVECLLQIHDELLFEFPCGAEEFLDPLISSALCESVRLKVPIRSSSRWGNNWGELK